MSTFNLALEAWQAADALRQRRQRYLRYTYGRQWDDPTPSPRDNSTVTERVAAQQQGQTPHTNNLIRQLVKCVIGNFRASIAEKDPAASQPIDPATARRNMIAELDCRLLEEFLISGCAIQRVVAERRQAGQGVWIDNVNPADFFVNRYADPRGLDIELVGMLHSMSLREVAMRFSARRPGNDQLIAREYADIDSPTPLSIGSPAAHRFFHAQPGRCRVIEVWSLESRSIIRCHDTHEMRLFLADKSRAKAIDDLNRRRRRAGIGIINTRPTVSLRWCCRFFTPSGRLLDQFDSPFPHGSHPFAIKLYPLIDGEVHSLVEDIIDQQRHINSLITLIDQIMRVSAKGVLLFPLEQKVDSMTWPDVAKTWAQPNSVLPYIPDASQSEPRQVISSADNAGAYRLLETHLSLFQQVSGVSDALQGRLPAANTSAALYDSQLRSSAVALLDLLDTFNSFRSQRNQLVVNTH